MSSRTRTGARDGAARRAARSANLEGLPSAGEVVAGRYVVERLLGHGGMGVVLLARHVQIGTRVAVKFLTREAARKPERVARLVREARAAAELCGEHVARVIDAGTLDNGIPFLVMEHLVGKDLGELLDARETLPISETVDYVLQACEGIAEAHAHGIVHRDLKPSNLFVTTRPDGSTLVKVLDFGVSKLVKDETRLDERSDLTTTGAVVGSPFYMSPEQLRDSSSVDSRTDIWSFGVILHELLTGRRPFRAESIPSLFALIVTDPPIPLRHDRPDVPAALESVVASCLEKDPARRMSDVAALAHALAPFSSNPSGDSPDRVRKIVETQHPDRSAMVSTAPVLGTGDESTVAWNGGDLGSRSGVVPITTEPHLPIRSHVGPGIGIAVGIIGLLALGFLAWPRHTGRSVSSASPPMPSASTPDEARAPPLADAPATDAPAKAPATATPLPASTQSTAVRGAAPSVPAQRQPTPRRAAATSSASAGVPSSDAFSDRL